MFVFLSTQPRTSSSHPVAPEIVPETETQEASHSEASDASLEWDDPNPDILALDDPNAVFLGICDPFSELLPATGTALPNQWSLPELGREVIGEEAMRHPSGLAEILSDLLKHGSLVLVCSCRPSISH